MSSLSVFENCIPLLPTSGRDNKKYSPFSFGFMMLRTSSNPKLLHKNKWHFVPIAKITRVCKHEGQIIAKNSKVFAYSEFGPGFMKCVILVYVYVGKKVGGKREEIWLSFNL